MQQIDRRENALAVAAEHRARVPQTIAQVDALEKKLSEALDELRSRRAQLQKAAEEKRKEDEKGSRGKKSDKEKDKKDR